MNPGAGNFRLYVGQTTPNMNGTKAITVNALTASNANINDEPVMFDGYVDRLRRAIIDKLCALRCEVDILRKGGWKVAIGPFLAQATITDSDRERFHETITERVQGKVTQALITGSPAVRNGVKSLRDSNGVK
jgi:hypothetical protein